MWDHHHPINIDVHATCGPPPIPLCMYAYVYIYIDIWGLLYYTYRYVYWAVAYHI